MIIARIMNKLTYHHMFFTFQICLVSSTRSGGGLWQGWCQKNSLQDYVNLLKLTFDHCGYLFVLESNFKKLSHGIRQGKRRRAIGDSAAVLNQINIILIIGIKRPHNSIIFSAYLAVFVQLSRLCRILLLHCLCTMELFWTLHMKLLQLCQWSDWMEYCGPRVFNVLLLSKV